MTEPASLGRLAPRDTPACLTQRDLLVWVERRIGGEHQVAEREAPRRR